MAIHPTAATHPAAALAERLAGEVIARIKAAYDPENRFRLNQTFARPPKAAPPPS